MQTGVLPLDFVLRKMFKKFLNTYTVKLGDKERFDKEQIGVKELFPVTNLPFTS